MSEKFLTIPEHFQEMKKKILVMLLVFLVAFIISYVFSDKIYEFLLAPLADYYNAEGKKGSIIYTGLTEAFFTYIKVAFMSALFFTLPFIAMQFFSFISPGLKVREKKAIIICFVAVPVLFLSGAFVAYYFIFPEAWKFLLSFEAPNTSLPIKLEARISEYLDLSSQIIIAFGLAFQLPILLTLLNKLGIISVDWLKKQRRFAIVIIFIIAAAITPPDVLSQVTLAAIMILLYEVSILLCIFFNKTRNENEA